MISRRDLMQSVPRALGAVAVLLAGAAAVASEPGGRRSSRRIDLNSLIGEIGREEDHVSALELAEWIKARRPGLRVRDVRSRAEFEVFHIPSAEHVALSAIRGIVPSEGATWVLYSDTGVHAAQAWMLMRTMGHDRVYFLRGGVQDWEDDVLNPALPPASTAAEREKNERVSELSRYFGGMPRATGSDERSTSPESSTPVARTRRRGC